MEVVLTTRHDAEYYSALPRADRIDLTSQRSGTQDQVCRTCTNNGRRIWATTPTEQTLHIRNGGKLEDLFCLPDKVWGSFRVLNQIEWRNRVVPLNQESSVPTRAVIDTCGQVLRNDCVRCDRFNAVQVRVAYTSSPTGKVAFHTVEREGGQRDTVPYVTDGSPVKYWNVTVGGSCSIGIEGVKVNGTTVHCDFQPRKKRVESPSCANCFYLDNKGESWQFHHLEVNENARLTPWEREQVPADEQALALWRKQTNPLGRRYWFEGVILKTGVRNGVTLHKVRFKASNAVGIIAADDDRMTVHPLEGDKCAVEILYPYNVQFRLQMPMHKRNRIWPHLPDRVRLANDCAKYTVSWCNDCRVNKACYYHAKGPETHPLTGERGYANPSGRTVDWQYPPHGLMHIEVRHDKIVAVDSNGNLPVAYSDSVANAAVFRMWFPTLLEKAQQKYGDVGRRAVFSQYLRVCGGLVKNTKNTPYRPNWLRNTTTEPGKSYCSHPEGPNLRKVFQDSFGSERVDWEFDHGAMTHDAVEEEMRVGYRQHSQTPQRLQEEILATDASHPRYNAASDSVPFAVLPPIETPVFIRIEAIGDMHHADGTPVTDTSEFRDALDNEVVIGESGEVERRMTKRQQLFGYELSRGYYGKRRGFEKTSMPASDPTLVVFEMDEMDPEQLDITDAWMCVECKTTYDQSEVNFFDPVCEQCNIPLFKNHTTRTTHNPRAGGGVGNAFVMHSSRTQEQTRLYSTLCPKWRLNASAVITLDDVYGPEGEAPAATYNAVKDVRVKIITVGTLTDEQKTINAQHAAKVDKMIERRTVHLEKYPDTTTVELETLYPTPRGTVYRRKAEGALSKMGGV